MFPVGLTDLSAIKYKKDILPFQVRCLFGAVSQIRTGDLILTKDALYLLSYNSVPRSLSIIYNNRQNVKRFFKKNQIFFAPLLYPENTRDYPVFTHQDKLSSVHKHTVHCHKTKTNQKISDIPQTPQPGAAKRRSIIEHRKSPRGEHVCRNKREESKVCKR